VFLGQKGEMLKTDRSVIPTFLPSYRVWTYNTSEPSQFFPTIEDDSTDFEITKKPSTLSFILQTLRSPQSTFVDLLKKRRKHKHHHKKKKSKHSLKRHISPHSPSRSNRFLSLLGYEQYYLDLFKVNKHPDHKIEWELEYVTFGKEHLAEVLVARNDSLLQDLDVSTTTERIHQTTELLQKKSHLTPYEMPDLTVGAWLKLAHRLAKDESLWSGFKNRIYVSALTER
jgi:endopolyphosphatase